MLNSEKEHREKDRKCNDQTLPFSLCQLNYHLPKAGGN